MCPDGVGYKDRLSRGLENRRKTATILWQKHRLSPVRQSPTSVIDALKGILKIVVFKVGPNGLTLTKGEGQGSIRGNAF